MNFETCSKYLLCCIGLAGLILPALSTPAHAQQELKLPAGFVGEMIYKVPNRQGSWVSMTTDPKGRLIVSDQYGTLYRVDTSGEETVVEQIPLKIGCAQGMLCAFDSLYIMAHKGKFDKVDENGNKTKVTNPVGLYRLRDTTGDDQYDSVEMLRSLDCRPGEHGPHAVVLGPDGKSIYICAGNYTPIPSPQRSRVPRVWQEDQLTPRLPDAGGHATGIMSPGGWVCKTDPDGKEFELISVGYRNIYDIAFNELGDLFTYDADMEWDLGLPWYRPTRVCHVTSGSEYGWRNGSGKWPTYFPDSLPPVLDIGPGSPTGITFGTGAKFPAGYQRSLFIADWSYGIIHKVDLQQSGASYTATKSTFCTAPVLPITDVVINPIDGAMYFLVGGRRAESALYRVRYTGDESTDAAPELVDQEPESRALLEQLRQKLDGPGFDKAWEKLADEDRFVRFAARTALEMSDDKSWYQKALESEDVQTKLESVLAMIRTCDDATMQNKVIAALDSLDFASLSEMQKLHLLRNYGLVMTRMSPLNSDSVASMRNFTKHYPANSEKLDRELARLLCAADSPDAVPKTLALLEASDSQKQQIHYAIVLHGVKNGWTSESRKQFLEWFGDSARYAGGSSFRKYLTNIRSKFVGEMPAVDRENLKSLWEKAIEPVDPYVNLKARPLVKRWALDELTDISTENVDIENGKKMFAVTQCYKCHIVNGEGGIVGPDLTNAGRRFSTKDLLETIIDPNKEVSDQYKATTFRLDDGRVITGRIANHRPQGFMVQEDMINPGKLTHVKTNEVEVMKPSKYSMMPGGLLDTLTKKEVADLIGYMKSVSRPSSE